MTSRDLPAEFENDLERNCPFSRRSRLYLHLSFRSLARRRCANDVLRGDGTPWYHISFPLIVPVTFIVQRGSLRHFFHVCRFIPLYSSPTLLNIELEESGEGQAESEGGRRLYGASVRTSAAGTTRYGRDKLCDDAGLEPPPNSSLVGLSCRCHLKQ